MINGIKKIALLATIATFFACGGGNDNTSDAADTVDTPGPVSEADRSRYNLNAPDEMVQEMQDSTEIDTIDSIDNMPDTLID